jgi:DNA-binding CsgD family transcriptional regulator
VGQKANSWASAMREQYSKGDVLRLFAEGLRPRQIADQIGVSPWAVYKQISRATEKLHARTTTQAVTLIKTQPVSLDSVDCAFLSHRQTEVMQLLKEGWRQKEIAKHWGVSPATVANYVNKACKKLHAKTPAHAIALAKGLDITPSRTPRDSAFLSTRRGKLARLLKEGLRTDQIADQLGMSRSAVYQYIQRERRRRHASLPERKQDP